MMLPTSTTLRDLLEQIYPPSTIADIPARLEEQVREVRSMRGAREASQLSQAEVLLITYPDQLMEDGKPPLESLLEFARTRLKGLITGIHVLPFFPSSSDEGFSVMNYREVRSDLGTWNHIARLSEDFHLMFDLVLNHASAESSWFRGFLEGQQPYVDYFITVLGTPDLRDVVRPRTSPLLTDVVSRRNKIRVWTTFSADQVDLNYENPAVLLEMAEVMLNYLRRGASFIRLDAVPYLWKEVGTTCINLPQVHALVRFLRAVMEAAAPGASLVVEANVPQAENLAYLGDRHAEAHMVYNFALPPLVLHAILTGNAEYLQDWAGGLPSASSDTHLLNFLASHDGIGLNAARACLPEAEIDALVQSTEARGGLVSYKTDQSGLASPYEINANFLDALGGGSNAPAGREGIARFVLAHAILLMLKGVPAIYFHSLFGSRGWPQGVEATGLKRSINRERLKRGDLEAALASADSIRSRIFWTLSKLIFIRASEPAFDPAADQAILRVHPAVFATQRHAPNARRRAYCFHNVSSQPVRFDWFPDPALALADQPAQELITGRRFRLEGRAQMTLQPYDFQWIAAG